ncbi:MAG: ABC transporter substrate-binding protein [Actinobacteria bacterium]|nr:ABC transporter substrate-binding protein [Actinomycetota bacterium]MCL5446294.1 ABC transporter substrate-binding protein [Actinomycetota bacterium]
MEALRTRLWVPVLVAAMLVISGCSVPGQHHARQSTASSVPVKLVKERSAQVNIVVGQVPMTLDSHLQSGHSEAMGMVDSLIWPSPFVVMPGSIPQLDTLVTTSAVIVHLNPETVVYTINPAATWSDGVPITAMDFIRLWKTVMASDTSRPDTGYRDIASIASTSGGKTVTVAFSKPYGEWNSLFNNLIPAGLYVSSAPLSSSSSSSSAPLSGPTSATSRLSTGATGTARAPATAVPATPGTPAVWRLPALGNTTVASAARPLVSGGPFQVVGFTPGREIILDRNPHWWGPVPVVSHVTIRSAGSGSSVAGTLGSSSYDLAYLDHFGQPSLAQATMQADATSFVKDSTTEMQILFNLASGSLTGSLPFRTGLASLINRPAIVSQVVDPVLPGSKPASNFLYASSRPGYVADGAGYNHPHPRRAAGIFQALGMRQIAGQGPDTGYWVLDGVPVVLNIVWDVNDPWAEQSGPLIASELFAAGFTVRTMPVSGTRLLRNVLPSGGYNIALMPVKTSPFPSRMEGSYIPLPAYSAPSGSVSVPAPPRRYPEYGDGLRQDLNSFYDPAVGILFSRAERHMNPMRSAPVYRQIDELLWHDMPSLPLFTIPVLTVYRNWIAGIGSDVSGSGPFYDISEWQLFAAVPDHRS